MRKYYYALYLVMFFILGCSESSMPTEIQLDLSIDGKISTIRPNQKFSLELDLNADAGFRWDYKISNSNILLLDSTLVRPKINDKIICGGLAVETFYFSSRKRGRCEVTLIEHRPWEKDTPPINSVQFVVYVK